MRVAQIYLAGVVTWAYGGREPGVARGFEVTRMRPKPICIPLPSA